MSRIKRVLLGDDPRALVFLLTPTALALVLDIVLRGRVLIGYAPQGKAIYLSSLLISAGFWTLPLWFAGRLQARGDRRGLVALAVLYGLVVLPLVTLSYGGQVLYHHVVHAYMGRDTVRLGFALRGTVGAWFVSWGSSTALVLMIASGVVITIAIVLAVRRSAPRLSRRPPGILVFGFIGALICFWIDMVDSRFLQAATPDDCFVHGVVHAVRVGVTGQGRTRRGVSIRTPAPLPPLPPPDPASRRPNVLLVLTESVRADQLCSDPPPFCEAKFLDAVAAERISLGKLTTPSPGTFGACVLLWTGLPLEANVKVAHSAPLLWEIARAAGYRTAYITSQNLQFENFSAFFQQSGIDVTMSATELGGLRQEQLGAPDERATEEMLRALRAMPKNTPYFGVLHLSNTHAPYRVDPELQPFEPHAKDPLGDVGAFHNHYRNSVLLQERTIAAFLREVRAFEGWDDTVVLVLSDHGEQFRERGGLYHLHSLYDEEVRVPGFVLAGSRGMTDDQRAALRTFAGKRTYFADVHATVVDLFGLSAVRARLPYNNASARSLIDRRGWSGDPTVLLSTATAVWDEDNIRYGVMRGEKLLFGAPGETWTCFDAAQDPAQQFGMAPEKCGQRMMDLAEALPR